MLAGGFGFGAGYYCAADSARDQDTVAAASAPAAGSEQKLAAAIAEINRLRAGIGTAAAPARDFPKVPASKPQTYASLLEKLDKLPEPVIEAQLEKYLGRETLNKISDTRAFSRRLLEVALEDQDDPPEEDEDTVQHVDIQFSKSPVYGKQMLGPDAAVSKFEPLFAHIDSAGEVGEVIVKWQEVNTGEILIFKKMTIGAGGESFITVTPASGWKNSLYRVSLNSIDDSVQLMGSNAYTISQIDGGEGGRKPNMGVIEDLISMGLVTPKRTLP